MGNCCECLKQRDGQKQHHPELDESLNQQELQQQNLIEKNQKNLVISNKQEVQERNDNIQLLVTQSESYTNYLSESDEGEEELFIKLDQFVNGQIKLKMNEELSTNEEQRIFEPHQTQFESKSHQYPQIIKNNIFKRQQKTREKRNKSISPLRINQNLNEKKASSVKKLDCTVQTNYLLHYKFQNLIRNPPLPSLYSISNQINLSDNDVIIQMEPDNFQNDSPLGSEIHDLSYNCQKCGQEIKVDIYQLQCYHSFHKGCLLELVEEQINQDRIKIVCFCQSSIQSSIIRELMAVGEENALLKRYFSNQYEAIHKNIF